MPKGLTANACWLTCTEPHGFQDRFFRAALGRLPTSENGQSAACLAVAGCCQPDRRSRALASCERRRMPGCFGLRFALAACSPTDQRSTLLVNRSSFELRGGLGACCTVTSCQHQKIVKVPYSIAAASSHLGDRLDDAVANCDTNGLPNCWCLAAICGVPTSMNPHSNRRSVASHHDVRLFVTGLTTPG